MKTLAMPVLALALAGCTAIRYESLAVDSAAPEGAESLKRCPPKLDDGTECTARIHADQWATPTGIHVLAGQAYCITVLPNQVWFDADRRNTPPDGEKGSWIMNVVPKRHPKAGYFSLMVDVDTGSSTKRADTAEPVAKLPDGRYTTAGAGSLVLYPNDAIGPVDDPAYYYKNNAGYIWVRIKHCGAKQ